MLIKGQQHPLLSELGYLRGCNDGYFCRGQPWKQIELFGRRGLKVFGLPCSIRMLVSQVEISSGGELLWLNSSAFGLTRRKIALDSFRHEHFSTWEMGGWALLHPPRTMWPSNHHRRDQRPCWVVILARLGYGSSRIMLDETNLDASHHRVKKHKFQAVAFQQPLIEGLEMECWVKSIRLKPSITPWCVDILVLKFEVLKRDSKIWRIKSNQRACSNRGVGLVKVGGIEVDVALTNNCCSWSKLDRQHDQRLLLVNEINESFVHGECVNFHRFVE